MMGSASAMIPERSSAASTNWPSAVRVLSSLFAETVERESRQQSAAQADRFCTHRASAMPITICIAVMQSPIAPGKRGMSAASSERMISITPE